MTRGSSSEVVAAAAKDLVGLIAAAGLVVDLEDDLIPLRRRVLAVDLSMINSMYRIYLGLLIGRIFVMSRFEKISVLDFGCAQSPTRHSLQIRTLSLSPIYS